MFHHLTQSMQRMMARHDFQTIIVYLNDFLVIGKSKEECQEAFSVLLKLFQDLGLHISWHKVIGPTQKLVFLGVELDTHHCKMALPPDKLAELHQVISRFLTRCRVSKRQLLTSNLLAS